jgi:hypothetical protein
MYRTVHPPRLGKTKKGIVESVKKTNKISVISWLKDPDPGEINL